MRRVNFENIMLSEKQLDFKAHMVADSIYMKRPGQANPQRQKADQWLPGAGAGGGGDCSRGWGFFLG